MTGELFPIDFRLRIPCGEQVTRDWYFGDTVDNATDPPTVTGPQDWGGWTNLKIGFVAGLDAKQVAIVESPLTIEQVQDGGNNTVAILRMAMSSVDSASFEAGAYTHGIADVFGRLNGQPKKIRKGVWYAEFSATQTF